MIKIFYKLILGLIILIASSPNLSAQQIATVNKILGQPYNLIAQHSKDTQYYEMESILQKHNSDGTIQETDIYHLYLRCIPSSNPSKGDEFTCLKFTVQINNSKAVTIPSLSKWKYNFPLESKSD